MRRRIEPAELLRLAGELAYEGQGAGRPRTVNLRRAVSSAYYALFHAMTLAVAAHLLPRGSPDERHGIARQVTHAAVRQVCEWVDGGKPGKHLDDLVTRLRASDEISAIAQTVIKLQQAREAADYDHAADHTKAAALAHVRRAREAVRLVEQGVEDLDALLGLVALKTSLR